MSAFAQAADAEDGDMIDGLRAQRDELLEALKACLAKGSRWHPCDPVVLQARAAINNAKGEQV